MLTVLTIFLVCCSGSPDVSTMSVEELRNLVKQQQERIECLEGELAAMKGRNAPSAPGASAQATPKLSASSLEIYDRLVRVGRSEIDRLVAEAAKIDCEIDTIRKAAIDGSLKQSEAVGSDGSYLFRTEGARKKALATALQKAAGLRKGCVQKAFGTAWISEFLNGSPDLEIRPEKRSLGELHAPIHVVQIVGPDEFIGTAPFWEGSGPFGDLRADTPVWVRGVSTEGFIDGNDVEIPGSFVNLGHKTYTEVGETSRTVWMLLKIDDQSLRTLLMEELSAYAKRSIP